VTGRCESRPCVAAGAREKNLHVPQREPVARFERSISAPNARNQRSRVDDGWTVWCALRDALMNDEVITSRATRHARPERHRPLLHATRFCPASNSPWPAAPPIHPTFPSNQVRPNKILSNRPSSSIPTPSRFNAFTACSSPTGKAHRKIRRPVSGASGSFCEHAFCEDLTNVNGDQRMAAAAINRHHGRRDSYLPRITREQTWQSDPRQSLRYGSIHRHGGVCSGGPRRRVSMDLAPGFPSRLRATWPISAARSRRASRGQRARTPRPYGSRAVRYISFAPTAWMPCASARS